MDRKKTGKKDFLKATVAIIVALAFIMPGSAIFANDTYDDTIVSVIPAQKIVENGETFDLFVYVNEPAEPICSVAIRNIYFDATLLQVDAVELQGFFDPYETMGSTGIIDNVNGVIANIYEFTFPTQTVETANNFLKITFTADATNTGTSAIELNDVRLLRPDTSSIPVAVFDGEVQIGQRWNLTVTIEGNGSVTLDPAGGIYVEGTSVELTAVPDSDWEFNKWSGDLTGSDNPETIIMDGDKDVTANFTKKDTTPPVTICILDPEIPDGENGWYVSAVTVTLVATDEGSGVASTWYRLDSGYWKIYFNSFVVSKDGYHTVEYYSFDCAGNREDTKTTEFKIDAKPPVTTHEFDGVIGKEGWFVGNVTVTLSATDATSGVNYTKYKLDDGKWTNYTEPFDVTENGEYVLYYYSVDLAGNIEPENEVAFKIEHDTVPPVTTHEFEGVMGDNDWYISNVVIMLSAEDDSAGVAYTYYKLDDDIEWTENEYQGPFTFPVREEGNHTIKYYSVDRVGNEETVKGPFDFKIDKTVPTIDLTWNGENKKLVADVDDETSGVAKVEFYVNGECIGEATESPYELTVPNPKMGDKGQAIVYDNAGNENISAEIDAIPQGTSQSQSSSSASIMISQSSCFQ